MAGRLIGIRPTARSLTCCWGRRPLRSSIRLWVGRAHLNVFFSTWTGTGGGLIVKTLDSNSTTTNGITGLNLITGSDQIGLPVHVTVVPEPVALGVSGLPLLMISRRRRTNLE